MADGVFHSVFNGLIQQNCNCRLPEFRLLWQLNYERMDCDTAHVFTKISVRRFCRNVLNHVHDYTAEVITMRIIELCSLTKGSLHETDRLTLKSKGKIAWSRDTSPSPPPNHVVCVQLI